MADATGDAPDSSTSFCSTQPATVSFCKDFDDGKPVGYGFTAVDEPTPGLVTLDLTQAKSPPGSMSAKVLAGSIDDDSYAYASRTFDGSYTHAILRFQILIDPQNIATSTDAVGITVNPETDPHRINFEITATGARIEQAFPVGGGGTGYQDDGLSAFPLAGAWSSVELDLTLGSAPSLAVTLDGQNAGNIPLVGGFLPGPVRILIGPTFAPSLTKDLVVHLDDVALELE